MNNRSSRWVNFVLSCTSDMWGASIINRYRMPILVLSNLLTFVNAGPGKCKCVANDN